MLGLSMSSFFFGWLHEGITFPITLTLIIYCILNYHKHMIFKSPIFFCTVFYALGTFVCLSSPGTIQRIGQQDSLWQLMTQKIIFGGVNLLHLRVSYLMLAVSLLLFYKKRTIWKEHFNRYKYFYLTWIFTFIPVFGSGATETRVIFYTEFIATIIVINWLISMHKYQNGLTIGFNVAMLLMYVPVLH